MFDRIMSMLATLNNNVLWGIPMVVLMIGTGVFLLVVTKGVVFARFNVVMRYTTKTLFRVLIPMSVPGISTGITMVFVPAVSTFVISRMLGGGSNLMIGDLIEMQFLGNSYNLNVGSAMSLVLMIIVLLCMSFTSSFDEDEMEGVS